MSVEAASALNASPIVSSASRSDRRLSRSTAADLVAFGDFLVVFLGGLLPALIYSVAGNLEIEQLALLQSCLVAAFLAHLCLRFRGMYDTSNMTAFRQDPTELVIALCCGLFGVLGIGLPLALANMDLVLWYASWFSGSLVLILLHRMLSAGLLKSLADAGRYDERVAVFGAGKIARRVHDTLKSQKIGVHLIGIFDDRANQERLNTEGLNVDGKLDDLIAMARSGKIDRIIVALPPTAEERMAGIIGQFRELPVSTHIVTHIASDMFETASGYRVSSLGPIGLLEAKAKH